MEFHVWQNFLSAADVQEAITWIYSQPWKTLNGRRVQQHGAMLSLSGHAVDVGLPKLLATMGKRVADRIWEAVPEFAGMDVNHVLVNEYRPGQGIMPHTDGPQYHRVVGTISFGSSCILTFHPRSDSEKLQFWIPKNSLYVQHGALYSDYLHGVDELLVDHVSESIVNLQDAPPVGAAVERGTRVSITFRIVPAQRVGKGLASLLKSIQ